MNLLLILISLFLLGSCQSGGDLNGAMSDMSTAAVKVTTDKESYEANEKIIVTITNGLDTPVTTADQHTYCSIIMVERQEEGAWKPIRNCTLNSPSLEVTVEADSVATVELTPNQQSSGSIAPGTYRATLVYTIGESFKPGQSNTVSSELFSVR